MKKYILIGLAVVCAVGTLCWFGAVSGTVAPEGLGDASERVVRPVPTARVQDGSMEVARKFPGTVQARNRVELAFSLDGLLVELNGREGKRVRRGEVLARIDERDFRHGYEAAKASYQQAKTELGRAKTLKKRNVISQAEYDSAETACNVAEAELRIRKKAVEDSVIFAPYDGVVAERYVENHEHIKKQTPVLSFKDIARLDVLIQVPERLIAHRKAEEFDNIAVRFDADPTRWFEGRVKEYKMLSDPITRTYEVAVSVGPPEDINILPGMTATVRLTTPMSGEAGPDRQVKLVPVEAVFGGSDGNSYAWLIGEQPGKPRKVRVTLGGLRDGYVEILDNLQAGQRVAVAGIHTLNEEMLVRPVVEGREGLDG